MTECGGCGRTRRAAARMPDGSARCQFCATRSARTCSVCGLQRTVAGSTDAGPVCASCYQAPQRPCGRCGRTRKIARRATASDPDLCYGCYQGAAAVCSTCGETRPCQRISSGSPICRSCRPRPSWRCVRCGRDRPVQAEWPRWAGLRRLLRACPPPPRRMRRLRGGPAADRQQRGGKTGLRAVRRGPRAGLHLPRVRPGRGNPQQSALFPLRPGRTHPAPACQPWRGSLRPASSLARGAHRGRQPQPPW